MRMPSQSMEPRPSPWELGGLTKRELAKRVWSSINDDDVFGRAGQLAYNFLFAIFPGLLFITALLGMLAGPGTQLRQSMMTYIATAMPPDAAHLVTKTLQQTAENSQGWKLALGLLLALFSASAGMAALEDTLNSVYDVREARPFWKSRGLAIILTIGCSALALIAIAIILYGNQAASFVSAHAGLGPIATWSWKILQWPIAFLFLTLVFAIIYYFAPDVEQRHWAWITPGSVIGILLWLVISFVFRVYLHFFNTFSATYGALGAVIILLMWFYVSGVAILAGGEVNAEIENAAAQRGEPTAKRKGHKTPRAA
ncbi:MAG TPA: YihY/virulence factor BrkB family protein [Terriglobales bacterium]|nr:YihY/virulence factor BrkB family protein [Terriglobales bacterium]